MSAEQSARARLPLALAAIEAHLASVRSRVADDIPTHGGRQALLEAVGTAIEILAVLDATRFERERADALERESR